MRKPRIDSRLRLKEGRGLQFSTSPRFSRERQTAVRKTV